MPQMVEISDDLFEDARVDSLRFGRSADLQIEHWATLGHAVERYLNLMDSFNASGTGNEASLSYLLATVNSPEGEKRLREHLASLPFPHYEPVPGSKVRLVRIEKDGSRVIGRFIDSQWVADATQ